MHRVNARWQQSGHGPALSHHGDVVLAGSDDGVPARAIVHLQGVRAGAVDLGTGPQAHGIGHWQQLLSRGEGLAIDRDLNPQALTVEGILRHIELHGEQTVADLGVGAHDQCALRGASAGLVEELKVEVVRALEWVSLPIGQPPLVTDLTKDRAGNLHIGQRLCLVSGWCGHDGAVGSHQGDACQDGDDPYNSPRVHCSSSRFLRACLRLRHISEPRQVLPDQQRNCQPRTSLQSRAAADSTLGAARRETSACAETVLTRQLDEPHRQGGNRQPAQRRYQRADQESTEVK